MLKAMSTLLSSLRIVGIGEMVETEEEAKFLFECGIRFGQGYLFGKTVHRPETKLKKLRQIEPLQTQRDSRPEFPAERVIILSFPEFHRNSKGIQLYAVGMIYRGYAAWSGFPYNFADAKFGE